MTDDEKRDRPVLPRDAFRSQRIGVASPETAPIIVTPDYVESKRETGGIEREIPSPTRPKTENLPRAHHKAQPSGEREVARNPFEPYGERTSSRPYAFRLPDPIDYVLRQLAAEERTHPLRVIDRILYDHLKQIGRLPPSEGS